MGPCQRGNPCSALRTMGPEQITELVVHAEVLQTGARTVRRACRLNGDTSLGRSPFREKEWDRRKPGDHRSRRPALATGPLNLWHLPRDPIHRSGHV